MTERPAEPAPVLVVACVVFASVATLAATLLATVFGALHGWVVAAAVLTGLAAGVLAGRATLGPGDGEGSGRGRRLVAWFRSLTRLETLALLAFSAVSLRQFGWLLFERGNLKMISRERSQVNLSMNGELSIMSL